MNQLMTAVQRAATVSLRAATVGSGLSAFETGRVGLQITRPIAGLSNKP
jgi:hypothetical protein